MDLINLDDIVEAPTETISFRALLTEDSHFGEQVDKLFLAHGFNKTTDVVKSSFVGANDEKGFRDFELVFWKCPNA